MPYTNRKPPIVIIVGPTAVGKTELSLDLATHLHGEIISTDSRLFYRGMDIGTAKPSLEERSRVPHRLIDIADPDEVWSLSMFTKAVQHEIQQVSQKGALPILVGGTGQYVRAIIEGWDIPPVAPNPELRCVLERIANEKGPKKLYDDLSRLDPQAADVIDYRNVRRTIRALEVIFTTGVRFSAQRQRKEGLYRFFMVGLNRPRPELYERIDTRIDAMLRAGFIEEVQGLLNKGYSPDLPSFSAIGYAEIARFLVGKISYEEAVAQIKRRTRLYVRRQANWFKANDDSIHWYQMDKHSIAEIEQAISVWLKEDN